MSLKGRLKKLEAAAPPEIQSEVPRIIVDPQKGETVESVYLRDLGEPYSKRDKSTPLVVRTIVYPKSLNP